MSSYLPLITGGGGAIVVLCLWVYAFFAGKIHSDAEFTRLEQEADYWKTAYARQAEATQTERRTVNETAQAGQVTNQLITALTSIAAEGRGRRAVPRAGRDPGLTAEDLGI